jgi:FtsH-binding integral membrane protein
MENNVSDIIVGLMMALFGLIGLFLVAGAADAEMYIFGLGLCLFAVLFDFGLIKRHYDRRDAVRAAVRENTNV